MNSFDRPTPDRVWQAVLSLRSVARGATIDPVARGATSGASAPGDGGLLQVTADGRWSSAVELCSEGAALCDLYLPLVAAAAGRPYAVAHLGQSLDGCVATAGGASQWVTGHEDVVHNHRLRALADAVLVGAGTAAADDPRLTVRHCAGAHPVRVVVDPGRRLPETLTLFTDDAAPTLLLCTAAAAQGGPRHGAAEVVGLPATADGRLCPRAVRAALAERGLPLLFVEGGGVTVSRFLEAGALDRLQVTVAPLFLGAGRRGVALPAVAAMDEALRPPARRFALGPDVLFDCRLHE
ncbi:RibD family protein [Azospirillum sp. ST 5-10]|uniref:RibD family protein n=1 Tax=unclassified Azospirillum TaxID=2630922 RepID=UPI003F49D872